MRPLRPLTAIGFVALMLLAAIFSLLPEGCEPARRNETLLSDSGSVGARPQGAPTRPDRPRLVVVIVVDQLRADYLDRWQADLLPPGSEAQPGGFRYLRERGADFAAANFRHFPLFTGTGHSLLLTGGYPYKTGILANDWFSREQRQKIYCVADPGAQPVGGAPEAAPMSPVNLLSTTVGDELKLATNGMGKVISLALKDRAAVLLGGRLADAVIWFDAESGSWASSSFYCRDGVLPTWVQEVNARRLPEVERQRATSAASAAPVQPPDGANQLTGTDESPSYKELVSTPWGNRFAFETAMTALQANELGRDEIPDLLAVSLSSNDYLGHNFGPNSSEVKDCTVQTDRQLADFLRSLQQAVPGGLASVTVALTSDHGVAPVPEQMQAAGFAAGRLLESELVKAAEDRLDRRFGPRDWVLAYVEPYLYLDWERLQDAWPTAEVASQVAARALEEVKGVYAAYPCARILEGRLPDTDLAGRLARAVYPRRAGDVLVVTEALWFSEEEPQDYATTHGSPYAYDTRVPLLLAGFGIRPGVYWDPVCPASLAPTLSALLRIPWPSACDAPPLGMALSR